MKYCFSFKVDGVVCVDAVNEESALEKATEKSGVSKDRLTKIRKPKQEKLRPEYKPTRPLTP